MSSIPRKKWRADRVRPHRDVITEPLDSPLPEDAAIAAAHPVTSGSHATYAEAQRALIMSYGRGVATERDKLIAELRAQLTESEAVMQAKDKRSHTQFARVAELESQLATVTTDRDRWRDVVAEQPCTKRIRVCVSCGGGYFSLVPVSPWAKVIQCRGCNGQYFDWRDCGNCPQDLARAERDAGKEEKGNGSS